jgi:hypothetical protein
MEIQSQAPWKSRENLPVAARLNIQFDPVQLLAAYNEFTAARRWDSLGSEYIQLCETHTRLPRMFFKDEEIKNVSHICEMDWENVSYQQMTLTEIDADYSLDQRTQKSQSVWDHRIAKRKKSADERWYRKRTTGLPPYLHKVLDDLGLNETHRARFAKLKAGSQIKPHIDYDTTYSIRVHIPIITNEKCFFGGINSAGKAETFHMPADGFVWFINPGIKHWAENLGSEDRVHLIISIDSHELIKDL